MNEEDLGFVSEASTWSMSAKASSLSGALVLRFDRIWVVSIIKPLTCDGPLNDQIPTTFGI